MWFGLLRLAELQRTISLTIPLRIIPELFHMFYL